MQSILPERGHQGRIAPAIVEDQTTETFADLLDTLAELESLLGQYRMTPDAPLDRAADDACPICSYWRCRCGESRSTGTLTLQSAVEDTAAGLLDTLAELASLPGGYTLTPDEPFDRAAVATLAQLLDAPVAVIDWETVQITGTLNRARITVRLRVMGGAR